MASDFVRLSSLLDSNQEQDLSVYRGEVVKPGILPGVLIGRTKVWRNGCETITEVDTLFPSGLTSSLDTGEWSGWRVAAWQALTSATMLTVGMAAKLILRGFNTTVIHGKEHLEKALARTSDVPLITITNHQSCFDDPGIWGAILSPRQLMDTKGMRWGASASEVIFLNRPLATFWSLGKVIPIVRGWGVKQPAMNFLLERLNRGHWVNIFPEGRVNWPTVSMRLRWGVGRLIAECCTPPIIVPVFHMGMYTVLPNPSQPGESQPCMVRTGNLVTVCVGKPLYLDDLRQEGMQEEEMRALLTERVQSAMESLGREARVRHTENVRLWLRRWHDTTDTTPSILT